MNIWKGHPLILIYHCQFQIIFHLSVSFCWSNSGISASNVGICALDVVVSDNKVPTTGKMILCWSCMTNIVFFLNCWLFLSQVGKLLSALCCSCDTTYLSTFPHDTYKLVENNHSSSGPSLRNISHIHKWEILHGECCLRQPRFLEKCEWHSLWYLTLMPDAVSLSDQGRRLHESSYLYRELSGQAHFANC